MTARKRCPLASGSKGKHCAMDGCQLWHGGMCDMSRVAFHVSLMPALAQFLKGQVSIDGVADAAKHISDIFHYKEADE